MQIDLPDVLAEVTEQFARYDAMARDQFTGWRLEVGGLVEQPLRLSLAELRQMPGQSQITKHVCIQGWTSTAEWTGVLLRDVIAQCRPLPRARYAVFHALDDKRLSEPALGAGGFFYETIDMELARRPQTLLAYAMNGSPLPVEHGAPLRLSVENPLPVAGDVRLELSQTPGLRTDPVPLLRVPAQGRIQVRVTATVSRSGQFSVEARATTPSGGALGPASRLLLRSTAYGTITVWLTGSAGAVLVLLAGLRIARRVRKTPGGAHRRTPRDGPGGDGAKPGTAAPADTAPSGTR